jgi:2-polyprenyl-3-methyl-5-hydroxy-6-metoxy-1,4-benzoquinol methylase
MYQDGEYLANNPTWHEEDSPYKSGLVRKILDRNQLRFETLVDVGCGAGRVIELVAEAYPAAKAYGFDISGDAATIWQSRKGVEFRQADYTQSTEHFDVALCLDVFEHVEDYYQFLRRLKLRSGHIVFNIPLDLNVMKAFGPGIARARRVSGHIHYFNVHTARETLRDCGYEIVDEQIATPVFSTLPRNPFQWLLALPRATLALLSKSLCAKLLGGCSLVVLARPAVEANAA